MDWGDCEGTRQHWHWFFEAEAALVLLEDLDHLVLIVGRQTSVANAVESVESVESVEPPPLLLA